MWWELCIVEDSFGRICVPIKIEDMNLKTFSTIKIITESRHLLNISHVTVDVNLMVRNVIWCKNGILVGAIVSVKTIKILRMWKRSCLESWYKHELVCVVRIVRLVNTWKSEFMKSLVDDLAFVFDEIEDTPKSAAINPSNGISSCCHVSNHMFTVAGRRHC